MSTLADLIRDHAVVDGKQMSNRLLATLVGVAPETINRVMRGVGTPDVATVDKIADVLRIPRRTAREAANFPPGMDDVYVPPDESRLLSYSQRHLLDNLIRLLVEPFDDDLTAIEERLRRLSSEELHQAAELAVQLDTERAAAEADNYQSGTAQEASKEGVSHSEMEHRLKADQQADYDLAARREDDPKEDALEGDE